MGFLGAREKLTPRLDELAHDGLVFERAYAQAPDTVASSATILTGAYPQTHRASQFGVPLAPTLPYLPDLLHGAGYRTAAFVGSVLLDPRDGPFQSYDRGFDEYEANFHLPQRGESRFHSVALRDAQVIELAIRWLAVTKQRPFFLWVNLHPSGEISYDRVLSSVDLAVGRLFDFLRTQSLYNDALIVVASSHGQSLGAHGEDTHGIFLYDETIHVPLILKLPGNQMARRKVTNRARLLDVAPTVLELAGVPVSSQMQGQSLQRIAQTSSQTDQPAYARSDLAQQGFGSSQLESWRTGKYLYIRAPQPELYDLSSDPSASHNLAQSSKATLETMAAQLQALDARLAKEPGNSTASGLTSSEMQKLASLGYVGLQSTNGAVNAATAGTDPKELIAAIDKTLRALSDVDDGKPGNAIAILRQVLASQPNTYLAQYAMGEALAQQQQYTEAIEHLHKAIVLQPDSAWAHLAMGLVLIKTGDFKTAAVHLEVASSHLPKFAMLHSRLADTYEHLGRNQDATRERVRASQTENKANHR